MTHNYDIPCLKYKAENLTLMERINDQGGSALFWLIFM